MCSATFSTFEEEILKTGLGVEADAWLKFQTAPEFEQGRTISPAIRYSRAPSDFDVTDLVTKFVTSNASDPMLIFVEDEKDEKTLKAIQTASQAAKLRVSLCMTEDNLKVISADATQRTDGVYVFPQKFGRGIDFKLMKDAKVLILMKAESKLTTADVD